MRDKKLALFAVLSGAIVFSASAAVIFENGKSTELPLNKGTEMSFAKTSASFDYFCPETVFPETVLPETSAFFPIEINSAGKDHLMLLDGIGAEIAQRIIDYRSSGNYFYCIEDIKNVKGIGNFVFEKIKDKIYVNAEKLPPKTETETETIAKSPPNFITFSLTESSFDDTRTEKAPQTENGESAVSYPLDINSATPEELMTIDGIGEVLARRIVSYREENGGFSSVEEIMDVKGIGEKLFEKIKDKIFVSAETKTQTSSFRGFDENENIGILDINKATAEEFDLLPGINPETAVKIVNFREEIGGFSSVYELLYVDGVTESVFNKIKDYVVA